MKIQYIDWNPKPATLELVYLAEDIIHEYEKQGYVLTLRQLYYQLVARGLIENTERSYKNLGNHITKARMAGLLDWSLIEDRNRTFNQLGICEDEYSLMRRLAPSINYDLWDRQDNYVEVWVEKEALGNVIARACEPLRVPYLACKGYLSASEIWRGGQRLKSKLEDYKNCVVIHLGDHDPSGIDMTRDNQARLSLFSEEGKFLDGVFVKRVALNMDQVRAYNPPPNPAKEKDTRARDYIVRYGEVSWELDALEPSVIEALITDTVEEYIDWNAWDETLSEEGAKKEAMVKLCNNWPKVSEFLETLED